MLKERKTLCDGYTNLFKALANEANLTAVTVEGYTKGDTGSKFKGRHSWNAVKINGSWYLVDCTLGAGYTNFRRFNEYYFFTPPSQFVNDHFPDDPKWQLLNNPLSEDEFERMPSPVELDASNR